MKLAKTLSSGGHTGSKGLWLPKMGGAGGHRKHYKFVPGEYVTEVFLREGALVDRL